MASVGDVVDQALRLANRVDPGYRQRALDAADRALRYYAERVPWPSLERYETFISNGTEYFTFPQRVRSVISIGDSTHREYVPPSGHFGRQYPSWEYGNKTSGGPFKWRPLGMVPVIQEPSAVSKLELNTTASDAQSVYVRGLAHDSGASGTALEYYETTEIVATGETPVATTNAFKEILSIEADTLDKDNDIVVKYQEGSAPAARIRANDRHSRYLRIQWLALPSAGAEFPTLYYTDPPQIVTESQPIDPQVPVDFLVWRVVGDLEYMAESAQAANLAWTNAERLLDTKALAQQAHGDNYDQAIPYAPFVDIDPSEVWW